MEPRFVVIPYERTFPFPVERAGAWLTDYRDDDPARAGAIVLKRAVRRREDGVVELDAETELVGGRAKGTAEVRVLAPDHWQAVIVKGAGRGSVYDYRLTPVPGGCRLRVEYRVRVRRWSSWLRVTLARPLVARRIHRMWGGFAASMAKELR